MKNNHWYLINLLPSLSQAFNWSTQWRTNFLHMQCLLDELILWTTATEFTIYWKSFFVFFFCFFIFSTLTLLLKSAKDAGSDFLFLAFGLRSKWGICSLSLWRLRGETWSLGFYTLQQNLPHCTKTERRLVNVTGL